MKGVVKSKTMWFSLALAVLGVLEMQFGALKAVIPDAYQGLVFIGIGVTSAVLRVITTQAISEK